MKLSAEDYKYLLRLVKEDVSKTEINTKVFKQKRKVLEALEIKLRKKYIKSSYSIANEIQKLSIEIKRLKEFTGLDNF